MEDSHTGDAAKGVPTANEPPDDTQRAIAGIWSDLLEVDQVGVEDNFLLLGGESLLATQAAARIRSRFGCDVTIRSVLVGTVREVAAEIDTRRAAGEREPRRPGVGPSS